MGTTNASDDDLCSQADHDDPLAESESESESEAQADQESFHMTRPNTPNLCSPANSESGVENGSDDDNDSEELENIDPRLRPVKRGRRVNVY